MPTISKTLYPIPGDETFHRVVSVDSKGQFSCRLPLQVSALLGYNMVTGGTKDEVDRKFGNAMREWKEASTTERKVILYKLKDSDHFLKGVVLSVSANVFVEKTISAGGKERKTYEVAKNDLPHCIREGTDNAWDYPRDAIVLEWTAEREGFFARVGKALEAVRAELDKLRDPEKTVAIADGHAGFLEMPKAKGKK